MERRFDMSDFEQSLKDYADQFKMMPSKRVWNGIYNHLHPGSKWPSISVAIVFIITLVFIGNSNNSSNRIKKTPAISSNSSTSSLHNDNARSILTEKNKKTIALAEKSPAANNSMNLKANVVAENKNFNANSPRNKNIKLKKAQKETAKTTGRSFNNITTLSDFNTENVALNNNSAVNKPISGFLNLGESGNLGLPPLETAFLLNGLSSKKEFEIAGGDKLLLIPNKESFLTDFLATNLKNAIENNSILGKEDKNIIAKKVARKKKNNIHWLYYLEPKLSYVSFHSTNLPSSSLLNSPSLVVLTNQSPFKLIRKPRPGFEAGIQAGFPISKKIQLISGIDLSYSAFSNISNLVHPTFSSLILRDKSGNFYAKNFISHYGNGESETNFPLVNYRFETGIPVGLQYNIWKNDKLAIDISSVIEPTFVLKSNAYVISSDGRYYLNDPALIREVNLKGKFGSYLSFYAKKIKWHIGPDIHYQLFSSYKDIYPVQEHLIDYGIRIGISK